MFRNLRNEQIRSYAFEKEIDKRLAERNKAILSEAILNYIMSRPGRNFWAIPHDLILKGFKTTDQYQEIVKELAAEGYDVDEKSVTAFPSVVVLGPDHPNNRLRQQPALQYQLHTVSGLRFYQANTTPQVSTLAAENITNSNHYKR